MCHVTNFWEEFVYEWSSHNQAIMKYTFLIDEIHIQIHWKLYKKDIYLRVSLGKATLPRRKFRSDKIASCSQSQSLKYYTPDMTKCSYISISETLIFCSIKFNMKKKINKRNPLLSLSSLQTLYFSSLSDEYKLKLFFFSLVALRTHFFGSYYTLLCSYQWPKYIEIHFNI